MSNKYNNPTTGRAHVAHWSDHDIQAHIKDEWRYKVMAKRARKPIVSVQVINIGCPDCGSICENESGSSMIEETDAVVTCTGCGEVYKVPTTAFKRVNK